MATKVLPNRSSLSCHFVWSGFSGNLYNLWTIVVQFGGFKSVWDIFRIVIWGTTITTSQRQLVE